MTTRRNAPAPWGKTLNEPDLSKVFMCDFCGNVSYWTRVTPDPAMFCLTCRCSECLGLMAFQTTEEGKLHSYCPACIRKGDGASSIPN